MRSILATAALSVLMAAPALAADDPIEVTLKDHKFEPSQIHVKANEPFVIHLTNEDGQPEEFDSSSLGVEKIVAGGSDGLIRIDGLPAGQYPFIGEFHSGTAQGRVVAE